MESFGWAVAAALIIAGAYGFVLFLLVLLFMTGVL